MKHNNYGIKHKIECKKVYNILKKKHTENSWIAMKQKIKGLRNTTVEINKIKNAICWKQSIKLIKGRNLTNFAGEAFVLMSNQIENLPSFKSAHFQAADDLQSLS